MGWDGSGNFNRTNGTQTGTQVWQDSRDAGTKIRADGHDTHDQDIADGMENTLTRDGQNSPSANLPMNSKKHTGVVATSGQSARNEYTAAAVVQDGDLTELGSVAGTADAITANATPSITAYAAGQRFSFVATGTCTTAVTIAINGLVAKAIQKLGAALVAGDITSGDVVEIFYDGTQFQMVSPARTPVLTAGGVAATAVDIAGASTATPTTADSLLAYDDDAAGNVRFLVSALFTLLLAQDQTWVGSQRATPVTDNDGSFDMDAGNDFVWTPTGADTLEFTNETSGQRGMILLVNGSNYTITLGAEVKAPSSTAATLSVTGTYLISYWCYDGTNVAISNTSAIS